MQIKGSSRIFTSDELEGRGLAASGQSYHLKDGVLLSISEPLNGWEEQPSPEDPGWVEVAWDLLADEDRLACEAILEFLVREGGHEGKDNPLENLRTGEGRLEGLRCPKCGYTSEFVIGFATTGCFDSEGLVDDGDREWDDESYCECRRPGCTYQRKVADFTVGWVPNPNAAWNSDAIQLPRLLAELEALGLTDGQWQGLSEAMDLTREQIGELFTRAQGAWDGRKATLKERADRLERGHVDPPTV